MRILPRTITLSLAVMIIALAILGVIAISGDEAAFGAATELFDLDSESSIPNWVSTVMLLFLALITAFIASSKTIRKATYALHWRYLSLIFLLLSIEEVAALRDRVITPRLRSLFDLEGILYFAWVIPAFILIAIFLVMYIRFTLHLPRRTRFFFITGIMTYLAGAVGFELINGVILGDVGQQSFIYDLGTTGEETLELIGILSMLHGWMIYVWNNKNQLIAPDIFNSDNYPRLLSRYMRDAVVCAIVVGAIVVGFLLIKGGYINESTKQKWRGIPVTAPPLQTPVVFGDDMPFWGAQYSYQSRWHVIDLNLWWWVKTTPEDDYSIVIYLVDEAGEIVAQVDGIVEDIHDNEVETSEMSPERIYLDERAIVLPDTLPAGEYLLQMAVYHSEDETRLPLSDGETLLAIGDIAIP